MDLARELKTLCGMSVTVILIILNALGTIPKDMEKNPEGIGNRRKNQNHPNCSIVEIGYNTEKSPGNLRRFAVTQTPVKDPQLTLV